MAIYIGGSSGTPSLQTITTTPSNITGWGYVVKADTTSANLVLNVPTAVGKSGQKIEVSKVDISSNIAIIYPFTGQTINGSTSPIYLYNNGDAITLISDGANSIIISDNRSANGSTASYLRAYTQIGTNEAISIGANIKFATIEKTLGTNVSYVPATGVITLQPNITYRLRACIGYTTFSGEAGYGVWQFFDITANGYVGCQAMSQNFSRPVNESKIPIAEYTFTPSVLTTMAFRNITGGALQTNMQGHWLEIEEVSRQTTAINTVDYGYYTLNANQTISSVPVDVSFNTVVTGGIPLNTSTSAISLTAGKTYSIETGLYGVWGSAGGITVARLCDASTNTQLLNSPSISINGVDGTSYSSSSQNKFIYTPTANQTIKIRITDSSNNCVLQANRSWLSVTQVGSTGQTGVPIAQVQSAYAHFNVPWNTVITGLNNFQGARIIPLNVANQKALNNIVFDDTNDKLTINTAGVYRISFILSGFSGAGTTTIENRIKINNTIVTGTDMSHAINMRACVSSEYMATLASGDFIQFEVNASTNNIDVYAICVTVQQIS